MMLAKIQKRVGQGKMQQERRGYTLFFAFLTRQEEKYTEMIQLSTFCGLLLTPPPSPSSPLLPPLRPPSHNLLLLLLITSSYHHFIHDGASQCGGGWLLATACEAPMLSRRID